jgi:hypothetical protein
MKKQKNIAIFIASLSMMLMVIALVGMHTAQSNDEIIYLISGFLLAAVLGILSILDYEYLTKKQKYDNK